MPGFGQESVIVTAKRLLLPILVTATAVINAVSVRAASADGGRVFRAEMREDRDGCATEYILIKPLHRDETKKYPLFIFMHGAGSSPEYLLHRDAVLLNQQDLYVLLPRAPDNYGDGYSWYHLSDRNQLIADLGRDECVLKDMIEQVSATNEIDRTKITLAGFSQGGRVCFYVGFRNPRLFCAIVPVGGYYMPELLDPYLGGMKGLRVDIFHGTHDDVNSFDDMKSACEKFRQKGVLVTMTSYPLGHTYTSEILASILDKAR
jgi:predicted esterase